MQATVESETDPVNHRQDKMSYLKKELERKINASYSCMLLMALPVALLKKLETHMNNPIKIFEIICDKYDKKGNNKLSNLCKLLESCVLNNIGVDTDYWFTYFSHLNYRIDNISIYFRKKEKQLSIHIMNNMCK